MSSQKRFLCEAKTSGAVEAAAIVVRCDDRDDARELLVDMLGLGVMDLKISEITPEMGLISFGGGRILSASKEPLEVLPRRSVSGPLSECVPPVYMNS